jgi:hypothetical protein
MSLKIFATLPAAIRVSMMVPLRLITSDEHRAERGERGVMKGGSFPRANLVEENQPAARQARMAPLAAGFLTHVYRSKQACALYLLGPGCDSKTDSRHSRQP